MWPFKSRFDKLTREEVVDSICKLEQELNTIEDNLVENKKHIDTLIIKGKSETEKEIKLFYAKKINSIKMEREEDVRRAMYLMYNIRLMNKLKNAIDDNQFFKKSKSISLGNLLKDQKGLAKFLNKALKTRVASEDVLTNADELFKNVEESYEKNESIYGLNDDDNSLLALFETEEMVNSEVQMHSSNEELEKKETE